METKEDLPVVPTPAPIPLTPSEALSKLLESQSDCV